MKYFQINQISELFDTFGCIYFISSENTLEMSELDDNVQ